MSKVMVTILNLFYMFSGGAAVATAVVLEFFPDYLPSMTASRQESFMIGLLGFLVFREGIEARLLSQGLKDASRELVKSNDFAGEIATAARKALHEWAAVGRRIKNELEWRSLADSISPTTKVLGLNHVQEEDNLKTLLDMMINRIKRQPSIARHFIFTVDIRDKYLSERCLILVQNAEKNLRDCRVDRNVTLLLGNAAAGPNITIADGKHWLFSPSDKRENALFFYDEAGFASVLEQTITARWIFAREAKTTEEFAKIISTS